MKKIWAEHSKVLYFYISKLFLITDQHKKLKNLFTHTHLSASHPSMKGAVNSLGSGNFLFLIRRPRI